LGWYHGPNVASTIPHPHLSERNYPTTLDVLAIFIKQPSFLMALRQFVYMQRHLNYDDFPSEFPEFSSRISVFHSAVASFYAPSDLCGAGGMYHERIRANPQWKGNPRFDTVFVAVDDGEENPFMHGMMVARVLLFFSFSDPMLQEELPCALINWFIPAIEYPDPSTGMW
ncbi:hypothetical protein F5148DRAFT_963657, partial [Russula earlei]